MDAAERDRLLPQTETESMTEYKGARPKVRSAESRKVRSFSQGTVPSPSEARETRHVGFGVKSYLHHFYESVSEKSSQQFDEGTFQYLVKPTSTRRAVWRGAVILSVLLLAGGLSTMMAGYLVPRRDPLVGHKEEMAIIDRSVVASNRALDLCKVVGLALFGIGSLGTAAVCLCRVPAEPDGPFLLPLSRPAAPCTSTEGMVPATENLESVQPRGSETEMIMTNTGLCKVPQ